MTLPAGSRVGPYEIIAPIGAGGMGEVYRARDGRLSREVAIKVLPERLAQDQEARSRFEKEARAVGALSHPNILAIHDVGVENGLAFAVTELLEGETLRRRLDRSAIPVAKAIDYGVQIAAALAAAHEKEIVHRDIKPDNIFLTRDGRIKVLDFGVAKKTGEPIEDATSSTADTEPGILIGTVGYMSPEQIRSEPVDARSDIFSFGCVLYEMITARRAFRKATPADTLAAVLNEDPKPIDVREVDCPPELIRIVRHCIEKNRESRFQSARDLAFALETIMRTPLRRSARRRGRRRLDSLAILPLGNATGDEGWDYLVDGITEDLINALAREPTLRIIARSTVFRYKGLAIDPRTVGRDLEVAAVVTGRTSLRGNELDLQIELVDVDDGAQLWGERFHRPISELLSLEQEISRAIVSRIRPRLRQPAAQTAPTVPAPDAYDLYLRGRYHWNQRTEEGFQKAVELLEEAVRRDPTFALAYAGIADAYTFLGGYGHLAPDVAFPRARAAAERALSLADIAEAHSALASVFHRYDWNFPAAETEFRRALDENPVNATAHHWYGLLLLTMGRFEEATAEVERAQALDPLSRVVWEDRGYLLFCRHAYAEAEAEFRKVLEMDANFTQARFDLGITLAQRGLHDESVAEIRAAIATAGPKPRSLATLAWALAMGGRREEALALINRLDTAPAFSRALVHAALGERDAAFGDLEQAFARREDALVSLRVNPRLDPLRDDPRFDELLRRVGFPPREGT